MPKMIAATIALALASPAAAGLPNDADVAAVQAFVKSDKSYTPTARAEAERLTSGLKQFLGNEARFELEVARIVALANNGHTALFPPQWTRRYPRSPVRVGMFADGLFVIAAPPEHASALGKPVATINGRPWREVRARYSEFQGGTENFKDQFFPIFAETPELLAAAGLGDDQMQLSMILADGQLLRITAVLSPLADAIADTPLPRAALSTLKGPRPFYLQHGDRPLHFETVPRLDAAYVRLDRTYGKDIAGFLKGTHAQLKAGRQRHIILDLRFNGGGDLNTTRNFAKALPGLAKGGNVYIVTSARTFSAAISTVGYVKQAGGDRVRIVGEPLGDRLEFWAEGRMIQLPGLGALILNATERHNYRTGCGEADCHAPVRNNPIRVASLDPDLPAPLTFAAYAAGRDPAMEAIARDVGKR